MSFVAANVTLAFVSLWILLPLLKSFVINIRQKSNFCLADLAYQSVKWLCSTHTLFSVYLCVIILDRWWPLFRWFQALSISFCSCNKQNCGKCCKDTSYYGIREWLVCHNLYVLMFQINLLVIYSEYSP